MCVACWPTWPDCRSRKWPHAVRVEHHKTGTLVWHPLEEMVDGELVKFHKEAERIMSRPPKLGIPMIMRKIERSEKKGQAKIFVLPRHGEGGADPANLPNIDLGTKFGR